MLKSAIDQNNMVQSLLEVKENSTTENNLLKKANIALGLDDVFKNVEKKSTNLKELNAFNMSRLEDDAKVKFAEMSGLAEQLDKEDASDAGVGFGEVYESTKSLQLQGLPTNVIGYDDYYKTMNAAEVSLSEIDSFMNGLAAELPRFTQNITLSLETATRNSWLEEAQIAILNSQFKNRESFSIYKDWSLLGKLDDSLSEEVAKLEAHWAEVNSVCTAMLSFVEEIENMDTTLIWAELSEILTKIKSVETSAIGREHFADCEQGYALSKRGNIELQAKELFGEIKQTTTALVEKGVGPYIEEFGLATESTAELKDINIPQSQVSYDKYASKAYLILANLDKAEELHSDAVSRYDNLNREYQELQATIGTTPLGKHPEYIRTIAELIVATDANIIDQNAQLQQNLDTLKELVKKFENGTLINCTFDKGFEMLPVLSDAGKFDEAVGRIKKSVKKSGVAFNKDSTPVLTFCIDDTPVMHEDLLAFGQSLKTRQADIKMEIGNAKAGSAGAAVNISFWLAKRYADWVGKQTKKQVCVAPAIAAVLAELSIPDNFETISTGELFHDSCGSQSAVSKKLVLYDVEDSGMTAGCVSNNSLRPELSFRLAAGEICTE